MNWFAGTALGAWMLVSALARTRPVARLFLPSRPMPAVPPMGFCGSAIEITSPTGVCPPTTDRTFAARNGGMSAGSPAWPVGRSESSGRL
jgi:hypothetical protein